MKVALHPIESKVLGALKDGRELSVQQVAADTGLKEDQVRRSAGWLSSKGYVNLRSSTTLSLAVMDDRLPELALVEMLGSGGWSPLVDLKSRFKSDAEFSAALGRAKRAGWVTMSERDGKQAVAIADSGGPRVLRQLLATVASSGSVADLPEEGRKLVPDLLKRGVLQEKPTKQEFLSVTEAGVSAEPESPPGDFLDALDPQSLVSGSWKGMTLRPLDVEAQGPRFYPGRRHPVRDFIREVREAYVSMGFTELQGESVQPAFWNFDALFIPQDHPGRDMQDTFYLKGASDGRIVKSGVYKQVASTHENGWTTGSAGWGYRWRVEEARRLVLRTHNTVLTIRALSGSKNAQARVFAVSKVYRNENLDYKHLAEFYQMDGIIVGEGLNVRHLMGFLKEFYKKLGMKDVKLWPSYFPYTEPSLQVMGYSKVAGAWIELGGSGVFRPEVTRPLGVRVPVLAWGPGIERLMLLRYGLDDLRSLYEGRLGWLRNRVEYASSLH